MTELISKELGVKFEITKEFISTCIQAIKRFDKKQEIFSVDIINDYGLIGIASKLSHYQQEIKKYLSVDEEKRVELGLSEEKMSKNLIDMGIYSFIAYMYINNKFKKE